MYPGMESSVIYFTTMNSTGHIKGKIPDQKNNASSKGRRRDLNFFELRSQLVALGVVLGVLAFLIGFYIISQFKSVTETSKSEAMKVPKEIRLNVSPAATFRVPILMYHYVEYVKDKRDTIRQSLDILPNIFDKQLSTLVNAGYTFMTASELADVLDGKSALPPKPILLTFDDGHWDLYTDVLPILEKYHVHATAYIISGFIGGTDFMTKDQLEGVIKSGLVEIGAHTVHHISLAQKLFPVVEYEVLHSKESIQNTYHLQVVSFAYPNGSFDQQAADIVRDAGFRTAVSTVPGIAQSQNNRFYLYRLRPGGRTGDELLRYLTQTQFKAY